MNQITSLFQHPVSLVVAVAVVVLVIRLGSRLFKGKNAGAGGAAAVKVGSAYILCFFSGILFTNALAHFSHGISGEQFPAPFGYALGTGFLEHLSNVLWGFLNLVLGYSLFVGSKVFNRDWLGKVVFFAGVLVMGVFLSYVFSH